MSYHSFICNEKDKKYFSSLVKKISPQFFIYITHVQVHFLSKVEHIQACLRYEKYFLGSEENIFGKIGWPILFPANIFWIENLSFFTSFWNYLALVPDILAGNGRTRNRPPTMKSFRSGGIPRIKMNIVGQLVAEISPKTIFHFFHILYVFGKNRGRTLNFVSNFVI